MLSFYQFLELIMNKVILALALATGLITSTHATVPTVATAPTMDLSNSACTNPSAQFLDLARQSVDTLVSIPFISPSPILSTLTGGWFNWRLTLPNYHNAVCFQKLDPAVAKQSGFGIPGFGLEKWWEICKGNDSVKTNFGWGTAIARHANYYDNKAKMVQLNSGDNNPDQRMKAMADGLREAEVVLLGDTANKKPGALENLDWYNSRVTSAPAIDREFTKTTNTENTAVASDSRAALRAQYNSILTTRQHIEDACRAKGAHPDDIKKYLDKVMPLPKNHEDAFWSATKDPVPVWSHLCRWFTRTCQDVTSFGDKAYHACRSGDKATGGVLALRFLTYGGSYLAGYQAGKRIGKACGSEWIGKHVGALLVLGLAHGYDLPTKLGIE